MYDPKLLKLFIENIDQLEAEAAEAVKSMPELSFRTSSGKSEPGPPATECRPSSSMPACPADVTAELVSLGEFCGGFARQLPLPDLLVNLECHIRRLLPFSTCVFYLDNGDRTVLAAHAGGKFADLLQKHCIQMGGGISGWAAAYAQPVINSRAALEFQGLHGDLSALIQAMVVPIRSDGLCLGTISLFGEGSESYSNDQMKILQMVANQAAPVISEARLRQPVAAGDYVLDPVTGTHRARYLSLIGTELIAACPASSACLSLIRLDLPSIPDIVELCGAHAGEATLRRVAEMLRGEIREKDTLVRFGAQGFVVLLAGVRQDQAWSRAQRFAELVAGAGKKGLPDIVCRVGVASYPDNGSTIAALLDHAQPPREIPQAAEAATAPEEPRVLAFPATC